MLQKLVNSTINAKIYTNNIATSATSATIYPREGSSEKKGECIDHAGKDQIYPWRDFAKDCLTNIKGCAVFAFLRAHNLTHSQDHQAASTLDQFWGHYVTGKK